MPRAHTSTPSPEYIQRKLRQYSERGYIPDWIRPYTPGYGLPVTIQNTAPQPPVQRPAPQAAQAIPEHIIAQLKELHTALNKKIECPICFEQIEPSNIDITNACGHSYCKACLTQLKTQSRTSHYNCAVCRTKNSK